MLEYGYYNMDCMQGMKDFPDGYFDLAIVDPPYGIKENGKKNGTRSKLATSKAYTPFAGGDVELVKIRSFSAQTTLFQKYRMTARAGLCGTRTTETVILQTANWRGLPLKPPSADTNIHGTA